MSQVIFKPASAPQAKFIKSDADLIVYGGARGSGKTFTSLMRFLRWIHDDNFHAYVIRKSSTDMVGGGGAFDEAIKMFTQYDSRVEFTRKPMAIKFPHSSGHKRLTGADFTFVGLDGDAGKKALQGKQISACMVDEATHLTLDEIEWIMSGLRTLAKEKDGTPMKPSIWLTCNPDPDSYILEWIKDYYLYPENTFIDGVNVGGRPNPERNGDYRYFLRQGNDYVWGETYEELFDKYSHLYGVDEDTGESECRPMKFQFIGATIYDNPPLRKADPTYLQKLLGLSRVEKERMLYGSWFAREEDGGYWKRHWVTEPEQLVEMPPEDQIVRRVRFFDLASTVPSESNRYPDWTAGVLIAKTRDGQYIVEHVERFQKRAGEVENAVIDIVRKDREFYKGNYKAYLPQDPASAGQIARKYWSKLFAAQGIPIYFLKSNSQNSKLKVFEPFAACSENGLVDVLKDTWNSMYFNELESFDGKRSTSTKKDDMCDATANGFSILSTNKELPKINAKKLRMGR